MTKLRIYERKRIMELVKKYKEEKRRKARNRQVLINAGIILMGTVAAILVYISCIYFLMGKGIEMGLQA